MSVITLTTDFGTCDWFVGALKGVTLRINPNARIVDLTHEVPAGDVRAGAFALAAACPYFADGTVHVAVVDPGVGGARRPIAVKTRRFTFIGPDNGVLSLALAKEDIRAIRLLENPKLFLPELSHTFHGRDLFAPVAAHLSKGVGFAKVGARTSDYMKVDWPEPSITEGKIEGKILHIDRFGNAITNISSAFLPKGRGLRVQIRGRQFCPVESFYDAVPIGHPVAVAGSTGFVEIAVNGGNAARLLRLRRGTPVRILSETVSR